MIGSIFLQRVTCTRLVHIYMCVLLLFLRKLFIHVMFKCNALMQGHKSKAGTFMPIGTGSRFCPGSDLTRLEISTFLHYFLLNYE